MAKKMLILGAAGQIARILTPDLLQQTDFDLVLYGRNVSRRLSGQRSDRVTLVDGDFDDAARLAQALDGVDLVYLNSMMSKRDTTSIVRAMDQAGVKRLIGATIGGIEGEFSPDLDRFTRRYLSGGYIRAEQDSAAVIEASDLDYTLLRLTWLYNNAHQRAYELVPTGQPFLDAQVTREAVAQAIIDIATAADQSKYQRTTFGVGEPDTHYAKPSFY